MGWLCVEAKQEEWKQKASEIGKFMLEKQTFPICDTCAMRSSELLDPGFKIKHKIL